MRQSARGRIDSGAVDELDWAALGYTIHNICGAVEACCPLVARFFETELEPRIWHREPLRRMTLDIAGLRPRLLDRDLADRPDELRGFRHVFRNVYGIRLDSERVRLTQSRVAPAVAGFLRAHEEFIAKVRTITQELTG